MTEVAQTVQASATVPSTGRVQLALNVNDLDEAVDFYSRMFDTEPAKVRPGYANFAIQNPPLKLVLLQNPGSGGSLNHLGVEVPSRQQVDDEIARLTNTGLLTAEEMGQTCCYATQDKAWTQAPDGERWEVYTVLADSSTFGLGPSSVTEGEQSSAGVCCGADVETKAEADAAACC